MQMFFYKLSGLQYLDDLPAGQYIAVTTHDIGHHGGILYQFQHAIQHLGLF